VCTFSFAPSRISPLRATAHPAAGNQAPKSAPGLLSLDLYHITHQPEATQNDVVNVLDIVLKFHDIWAKKFNVTCNSFGLKYVEAIKNPDINKFLKFLFFYQLS
jgi:hypothetical protein